MQTKFNCTHCEKCCCETATQIKLTVLDLIRLSKALGKPVSSLFFGYLGFKPFLEDGSVYSFEPGLNIPCVFYDDSKQKDKCNVYNSRPLNCRMFPFWILVQFSKKGISDNETPCLSDLKLDKDEVEKYEKYSEKLGRIIDEEENVTQEIMKRLNAVKKVDLSSNISGQWMDEKEFVRAKINVLLSMIKREDYTEIVKLLDKEITPELVEKAMVNLDKMNELDNIVEE